MTREEAVAYFEKLERLFAALEVQARELPRG